MNHAKQQRAVVGIDPGLDGAVAALAPDGTLRLHPTLTLSAGSGAKREYDIARMITLLTKQPVQLAVIEAVGARPGQGVTSMFRFGYGYGLWIGLLSALGIPFQLVAPQQWKKQILGGTPKDKAAAIGFVQRRFPGASLLPTARSTKPHDGMAEAACLAELARRQLVGSRPGT